jgi:hypothetical protein
MKFAAVMEEVKDILNCHRAALYLVDEKTGEHDSACAHPRSLAV